MAERVFARRTSVDVMFDGTDITKDIKPYLLDLIYTDDTDDLADDLKIGVQDRDGVWLETWLAEAVEAAAGGRLSISAVIRPEPMYRSFGLDMSFLDKPMNTAKNMAVIPVREAIEEWEPRAVYKDGIVQHLPDTESAYHAGDGADGPGNGTSIGIEICVNQGGDFAAAQANAAALVRLLMGEHGISIERVVQHNHWNGKDCPYTIRHTAGAWEAFLSLCAGDFPWYAQAQDWVQAQGISDGARPDSPATRAEVWEMLRRFGKEGA